MDLITVFPTFRRNIEGFLREYSFNEHSESAHTQTLEETQVTPGEHCQLRQNKLDYLLWILPHSDLAEDATDQ